MDLEVGAVFRGEVYRKDVEIMRLAYGGSSDFYGQATRVGPVAHSGVWEEVVGDKHSDAS